MENNLKHKNHYVVSDVHSYYDAMIRALDEAGFFEDGDGVLVLLGDALDRGSKPLELINFLFKLKEEGRLIYVRGNHEELLSQMLTDISNYSFRQKSESYDQNGTIKSAISLANMYYDEEKGCLAYYGEDHPEYIDHRKAYFDLETLAKRVMRSKYYTELLNPALDYYEIDNYIFCHGWIPVYMSGPLQEPIYEYNPDWRDAMYVQWRAARWLNGMEIACIHHATEPGKTVVCGHLHASWGYEHLRHITGISDPFVDEGIIAIDAGIGKDETDLTKKIHCIVIKEDGAYFKGKQIHAPTASAN